MAMGFMRRLRVIHLVNAAVCCASCAAAPVSDSGGTGDSDSGGSGDSDTHGDGDGDGDGSPEPDPPPMLDPCEPLHFESTDLFQLTYTFAVDVGDIDGQPGDEIVAYHQGEIISFANGVPTTTPHPLPFGGISSALLLRADGDEHPDLIVSGPTNKDTGELYTFLGDGTGTFTYVGTRTFDDALGGAAVAVGPATDAYVGASYLNKVHIFPDALGDPVYTMTSYIDPMVGDVDGDGLDEIAIGVGIGQDLVELWTRDGDGYSATTTVDCAIPGYYDRSKVVMGDVDVDGYDDLTCMQERSGNIVAVTLLRSLGGFEFERQPTVGTVGTAGAEGFGDVVGDFDGDGANELLLGSEWYMRFGDDGNFACGGVVNPPLPYANLRVGDVDNDGRDEVVALDHSQDPLRVYDVP